MGKKEEEAFAAAREPVAEAKRELSALVEAAAPNLDAIDEWCGKAQEAAKAAEEALKPCGPKTKAEAQPEIDAVKELINQAAEKKDNIEKEIKAAKDNAKKKVMAALATAAPLTGDIPALREVLDEASKAGVPEKDTAEAQTKLEEMLQFHSALKAAATELAAASKGTALSLDATKLEEKIKEHNEGAFNMLNKVVVELWMQILTKPPPTSVATDELDAALADAARLGVAEDVIKTTQKKNAECKKAQNAKKIADRKAKKPPSDPPKPPEKPEAHPDVEVLKTALEEAMATAEKKLLMATTSKALVEAKQASLLTAEALLDLEERPEREEAHPAIAALEAALAAATEAKADGALLADAKKVLDEAIERRFAARASLALSKMQAAAAAPAISVNVGELGKVIAIAEKEQVDVAELDKAKQKLSEGFKEQSEGGLEPLSRVEELSHEGFAIIDPLKTALDEARKRGANEELLIKGQAKLDFWLEARARRDKAKKELDTSLAPPPCVVKQPDVLACLSEATEAKLDPVLLKAAFDKLEVAKLAQRVYAKSKAPPGTLAIDVLQDELQEVGGGALSVEQEKQAAAEKLVEQIKEKIELIKETRDNQKARDSILAKQVKKGATKQLAAKEEYDLTPAWVRKDGEGEGGKGGGDIVSASAKQDEELAELQEHLKLAEAALKAQEAAVKALEGTVIVPPDVIAFAQKKLVAAKTCDEMQKAQEPKLLDLDFNRLQTAIKASEFKFGVLPIAGLDELECNVPKAELTKAKDRLRDADRAQKRQQRARSQLSVRVNAPTGTATFDMLVKLVAEAKDAEVEEELIARAELKLKKMEELAASSLRAGPLAFVSFHLPCLRACVSRYAISLVEQAEEKRKQDADRQAAAAAVLYAQIGTWERGQIHKMLMETDVNKLKMAIHDAAHEHCPQELIETGRLKLVAIEKYHIDKERGLIKDDEPKKKAAGDDDDGAKKKKPKFKNYGYIKKEPTDGA